MRSVAPRAEGTARPVRESMVELASLTMMTVVLGFLALWVSSRVGGVGLWSAAVLAGSAVLKELGWVIGLYVPTLLGFYVLVVGEQLGQAGNPGRVRRLLGVVAVVSFAALVPGLLLVLVYCVGLPANIGPLFVVVPASGLLLFLTVQLGAFVVFDSAIQLADAEAVRNQARARLVTLRSRSRRPLWLVIFANVLLAAAVGSLPIVGSVRWSETTRWQGILLALAWAPVMCLLAVFMAAMLASGSRLDRVCAAIVGALMAVLLLAYVAVALEELGGAAAPLIVSIVATATLPALSAVWPLRRSPRWIVEWSLSGALRASAARSAARRYRRSSRRVMELSATLLDGKSGNLRSRIATALSVLRGE